MKWLFACWFKKRYSKDKWWAKYNEYLRSNKWKKTRAKILKRDNYECQYKVLLWAKCRKKTELHVHHTTYENVFCEKKKDLVTLCKYHHDLVHKKKKK